MDEKDMQQQTEPQEDGFLDGWEETGPEPETEAPAVDGEVQAEAQPEEQEKDGPDGGAAQAAGTTGGSGGAAQSGDGGPGGDGAPPAGGSGQPDGQQPPPPPAPKTWTLNHMGQSVTISEADVPVLAQKAMDYDRVRASYDEARPVMDLFRGFAQQAGMSVQEYVGRLRMQAKQMEGMDEAAARQAVEMEDREFRVAAQEAEESERQRQEAAQRQNAQNAANSTGSMKSAGNNNGPKDPFLEGWDE